MFGEGLAWSNSLVHRKSPKTRLMQPRESAGNSLEEVVIGLVS